jgi:hypothetical protein
VKSRFRIYLHLNIRILKNGNRRILESDSAEAERYSDENNSRKIQI